MNSYLENFVEALDKELTFNPSWGKHHGFLKRLKIGLYAIRRKRRK